jgi:hypothetical protein
LNGFFKNLIEKLKWRIEIEFEIFEISFFEILVNLKTCFGDSKLSWKLNRKFSFWGEKYQT